MKRLAQLFVLCAALAWCVSAHAEMPLSAAPAHKVQSQQWRISPYLYQDFYGIYGPQSREWLVIFWLKHHTWTCRQGGAGCSDTNVRTCTATATSCNITAVATHGGAVEVMCVHIQATTTATQVIPTTDGTWVLATASRMVESGSSQVTECAYNLNATGGVTTITPKISASLTFDAEFYEFTGTGSSFTFDAAAAGVDNAACTTACAGAAESSLITTGNNYILVQSAVTQQTITALSGYTGLAVNGTTGNAQAYKINVSSASGTPNWTNNVSGRLAGGALGIYEVVAAGTAAGFDKRRRYEVLEGE